MNGKRKLKFIKKAGFIGFVEKDFERLLEAFKIEFPGWISDKYLKEYYNLSFFGASDLERLNQQGVLDKEPYANPKKLEKGKVKYENMYRLSPKGFNILSDVKYKELNKYVIILTLILIGTGLTQIFLMIIQIILQSPL